MGPPRELGEVGHVREWWDEQPKRLLGALLAVDLAFVVLHIATDGGRGPLTSLDTDTGFAGFWGFGKALCAAWFAHRVFRRTEITVYLAWAVTFVTVALDDLAEIHENVGDWLAGVADLPAVFGLRGADLGELLVWAALGIPLLVVIAMTLRHADQRARIDSAVLRPDGRARGRRRGTGRPAHGHSREGSDPWAVTPIGVLEDGGELIVVSLVLTSAVAAWHQRSESRFAVGHRAEAVH